MDSKAVDRAMRHQLPVICDGKRYEYIEEYVLWYDDNHKRRLSVGLRQGNSLTRVLADKVELEET